MPNKESYTYDPVTGIATATISVKNISGHGTAQIAPQDKEFQSEYTGINIASMRANINLLKNMIKYDLQPRLSALKHVIGTLQHSKKYNPKDYAVIRLFQEYRNIQMDIDTFTSLIDEQKKNLKLYIEQKDKVYRSIEDIRKHTDKNK